MDRNARISVALTYFHHNNLFAHTEPVVSLERVASTALEPIHTTKRTAEKTLPVAWIFGYSILRPGTQMGWFLPSRPFEGCQWLPMKRGFHAGSCQQQLTVKAHPDPEFRLQESDHKTHWTKPWLTMDSSLPKDLTQTIGTPTRSGCRTCPQPPSSMVLQ